MMHVILLWHLGFGYYVRVAIGFFYQIIIIIFYIVGIKRSVFKVLNFEFI